MNHVEHYRREGWAIVRGVFAPDEVAELADECDRVHSEGAIHTRTFREGNLVYVVWEDPDHGPILRFVQWPSYRNPVLARYRTDPRLLEIAAPLIGDDVRQIINQIIWKPPGSDAAYAYHQDARFRRPAGAYRDLANSYVQTSVAIDPHLPESGCVRLYPGSHLGEYLPLAEDRSTMDGELSAEELAALGLDPDGAVDVILDPGDVALWHPYTVHGSGPNRSSGDRRSYVNGYVAAASTDLGEWAFRRGEPVPLGQPRPTQYEELDSRPEPHYVEGAVHPYRGD